MLLYRKTITPASTLTAFQREDVGTISFDIDSANQRAKQMLHQNTSRSYLNERARLLRQKHLVNQQHLTLDHIDTRSEHSIASLRKERQKQQDKERAIVNRLKFVEMETGRNKKTAEWARRKYSALVERRTSNLHMKETLNQERSVLERENVEYLRKVKEKSLAEKQQRAQNLQHWRQQHRLQAERVRSTKKQAKQQLSEFKQNERLRNKHRAMDVKMKEFDLVSKKSAISESKRQAAQLNWHERLVGELQLKKETFKRNQQLFRKLVVQTDSVRRSSQRAMSQLQRLEDAISSSRSRSKMQHDESRNSKSFFLTKD